MVTGEDIERAERILQITYREPGVPRQLEAMEVEREDFTKWLAHRQEIIRGHYAESWADMDPRLLPAMNTLFMHCFLVGLVIGRDTTAGIS